MLLAKRAFLVRRDIGVHAEQLRLESGESLLRRSRRRGGHGGSGRRAWPGAGGLLSRRLGAAIVVLVGGIAGALLGDGVDADLRAGSESKIRAARAIMRCFIGLASLPKLHPPANIVNSLRARQRVIVK